MHEMWMKARGSVRLRITTAATVVFALAFGLAAWAVVAVVQNRLEDQVREDAEAGALRVAQQLDAGVAIGALDYTAPPGVMILVVNDRGDVLGRPAAVGGFTAAIDVLPSSRAAIVRQTTTFRGEPVTVVASSPLEDVQRSVDALGQVLVWTTPLLVAGVGILVWWLVGRALRPVAAITREVEEITHTTMHRRVPEPRSNDEVNELARTMNDMLERLHSASERQRAFVSDASHELRTPVATVQTLLEVGLRSGDTETAARRALDANTRLGGVVTDLLDMARLDGAPIAIDDMPVVDVEDVVFDVLGNDPDPLVDTTGVLAGRIRGDRMLVARAVGNLVQNARRHARSRVAVAVSAHDGDVVVTVDDDGPGIPLGDRERVFERFVRLDGVRRRRDGGTGLGLSIVKRVAEQHGGRVRVGTSPLGGARFELSLPQGRAGSATSPSAQVSSTPLDLHEPA
jgi:signal transduction histidine kinase